jgi:hypothetical protein
MRRGRASETDFVAGAARNGGDLGVVVLVGRAARTVGPDAGCRKIDAHARFSLHRGGERRDFFHKNSPRSGCHQGHALYKWIIPSYMAESRL